MMTWQEVTYMYILYICCIKPLVKYKFLSASLLTLMLESITTGH